MDALQEARSESENGQGERPDELPLPSGDPVTAGAAIPVAYSMFRFSVKSDRARGHFVGLWAPTLFGAATYLQQKEVYAELTDRLSGDAE